MASQYRAPDIATTTPELVRGSRLKTLDIGCNGRTLSADPLGSILQLGSYHPIHGIVVASPFEQFNGGRFHDPEYVRAYRARMLHWVRAGKSGFGVRVHGRPSNLSTVFEDYRRVEIYYDLEDDVHVTKTLVVGEGGEVFQTCIVSSKSSLEKRVAYTMDLGISVNRASYGQLTEGGPIPIPASANVLRVLDDGTRFSIFNPNLEAYVDGVLTCNEQPVPLDSYVSEGAFYGEPVRASFSGSLAVSSGSSVTLMSTFRLRAGKVPLERYDIAAIVPEPSRNRWWLGSGEASLIIKRNLEYILGNCMIPVSCDSTCFITDHVALPLGWNRDNYWQIRFLLDVHEHLDRIVSPDTAKVYADLIRNNVRNHLNWVYRLAQRPHKFWHRSYLTTGLPKDGPVFQQDQQCYPLLEICDFFDAFPSSATFFRGLMEENVIPDIIDMLDARRDPKSGLCTTDETPGDDAVELPYHFSSHVLLWRTLTRVASLVEALGETPRLQLSRIQKFATAVHRATIEHFVSVNPKTGERMFAYLTDGADQYVFYHDANDIPTLFASEWGFISSPADLALWARTMEFALSPANEGGYYAEGAFGGLGSVHTRGPWPLGYFQELVYAEIRGKRRARADAWRRIKGAMFFDGLFSEAVDCHTGECTSKAWFSWPGAMIGSALLRDRLGENSFTQPVL